MLLLFINQDSGGVGRTDEIHATPAFNGLQSVTSRRLSCCVSVIVTTVSSHGDFPASGALLTGREGPGSRGPKLMQTSVL